MKITAEPRSDQWNADDFTSGPRTFTVAGVTDGTAEQKYDIQLVEGEGRAWRPPLTMIRVLIAAWGDESKAWIGRRVTLYQDPTVRFGRDVIGGIRISHLSHIDKPLNVKVTTTRGKREPVTVQPLKEPAPAPKPAANTIPDDVKANTERAVAEGTIDQYIAWLNENNAPDYIVDYVIERKRA
ncbi:hypothetical protein SEA_RADFAD_74 [Arthrobacter phage RadFad]|nr:hypothetical protein SEA_RADFAD_74 [Arthrobacter phage RadFad]